MSIRRAGLASLLSALLVAVAGSAAFAHSGGGIAGGLSSGFAHPILGLDHVAAMAAVGLWGAVYGRPAIWLLPTVFPLVMVLGGALGALGMPVPHVEAAIALSALLLGLAVALALKPPVAAAAVLVGLFAIFHGHAHGAELPEAANPVAFAVGFVVATGLLHLAGVALGLFAGRTAVRTGGAAIAAAGAAFLAGMA